MLNDAIKHSKLPEQCYKYLGVALRQCFGLDCCEVNHYLWHEARFGLKGKRQGVVSFRFCWYQTTKWELKLLLLHF